MLIAGEADKEKRRDIHKSVALAYTNMMTVTAAMLPDDVVAELKSVSEKDKDKEGDVASSAIIVFRKDGKFSKIVPKHTPRNQRRCDYLHFTFCKTGQDTMSAIGLLGRRLKLPDKLFRHASP